MAKVKIDEHYVRYLVALVTRYHQVVDGVAHDTPSWLVLDDIFEREWEFLDEAQQASVSGLGSDLAWLQRRGTPAPKGIKKPEDVRWRDMLWAILEIFRYNRHARLAVLRRTWTLSSPGAVADMRASLWRSLGFVEIAKLFQDAADDPNYFKPEGRPVSSSPGS